MLDESVPLRSDPEASGSNLPIRRSAAIAIANPDGQVLMLKRSEWVDEFKGVWSFPSTFVTNNIQDDQLVSFLLERIAGWMDLHVENIVLVARRMGIRPRWRLLMHLYTGFSRTAPILHSEKYESYQWVDGERFLSQFEYVRLGECAKSYLDFVAGKER